MSDSHYQFIYPHTESLRGHIGARCNSLRRTILSCAFDLHRSCFAGAILNRRTSVAQFKAPPRQSPRKKLSLWMTSDSERNKSNVKPEISVFETWRNPSWISFSHVSLCWRCTGDVSQPHGDANSPHSVNAVVRCLCTAIVFSFVGALHFAHTAFDKVVQNEIRFRVAPSKYSTSYGRLVKCNPFTGIRLKDVRFSSPGARHAASAVYVELCTSGLIQFIFFRRPMELNVYVQTATGYLSNVQIDMFRSDRSTLFANKLYYLLEAHIGVALGSLQNVPGFLTPGALFVRGSALRISRESHFQARSGSQKVHQESSMQLTNICGHMRADRVLRAFRPQFSSDDGAGVMMLAKGTLPNGGFIQIALDVSSDREGRSKEVSGRIACNRVDLKSICSFLSIPVRVSAGRCSGNILVSPLFAPERGTLAKGFAKLEYVSCRLHPDPESTEFKDLSARLRLEEDRIIVDHSEGKFGTIPIRTKGEIDLRTGYNLESQTVPFDVNEIVETFKLVGFVPMRGNVIGEGYISGHFSDPRVTGRVRSVSERSMADKVPLMAAELSYEFDAAAGNIIFPFFEAALVGGGRVTGSGGLYFDLTRDRFSAKLEHHPRSPKARYWNGRGKKTTSRLPPISSDEFDVDRWAPFRRYDSMQFKFDGLHIKGDDLLCWYGADYRSISAGSLGHINGSCHISGHVDDPNCRVVWSRAPTNPEHQDTSVDEEIPEGMADLSSRHRMAKFGFQQGDYGTKLSWKTRLDLSTSLHARKPEGSQCPSADALLRYASSDSFNPATGYYAGIAHLKLGDLPDARRVKIRSIIRNLDIASLSSEIINWSKMMKGPYSNLALLVSMDSLFKGTVCMQQSWESAPTDNSYSTPLELVSLDGALAVRSLKFNNLSFENALNGSLSASSSDFSLCLDEGTVQTVHDPQEGKVSQYSAHHGEVYDKIEVALNGHGFFNIYARNEGSELSSSLAINDKMHRIAKISTRGSLLEQFLMKGYDTSSQKCFFGQIELSMNLNLTDMTGEADLNGFNLNVGLAERLQVQARLYWTKSRIVLRDATLAHGTSKVKIDGNVAPAAQATDLRWQINVEVENVHVRAFAQTVHNCHALYRSIASENAGKNFNESLRLFACAYIPHLETLINRPEPSVTCWEVPSELPFSEQLRWYRQSPTRMSLPFWLNGLQNHGLSRERHLLGVQDWHGTFSARASLDNYSIRPSDRMHQIAYKSSVENVAQRYKYMNVSFSVQARDCTLGSYPLRLCTLSGFMEDGTLSIGPMRVHAKDGLEAEGDCQIGRGGSLDGSLLIVKLPIDRFPVLRNTKKLSSGAIRGNFKLTGTLYNPSVQGQAVWRGGVVQENIMSTAFADLACSNGRCMININAKVFVKDRGGTNESVLSGRSPMPSASMNGDPVPSERLKPSSESVMGARWLFADDFIKARISVPMRVALPVLALTEKNKGIPVNRLLTMEKWFSFDDDWLYVSVDLKRYAMTCLSVLSPDLRITSGESSVWVRLTGTPHQLRGTGHVTIANGSVQPSWLASPLHSLNGELFFDDSGIMVCKSFTGRCSGRSFSASGKLPIFPLLDGDLEEHSGDEMKNRKVKEPHPLAGAVAEEKDTESTQSQRRRDEIQIDFHTVPVVFENLFKGKASGCISVRDSIMTPHITGSLIIANGVLDVSTALPDKEKSGRQNRWPGAAREPHKCGTVSKASRDKPEFKAHNSSNTACFGNINDFQDVPGVRFSGLKLSAGPNMRVTHSILFNITIGGHVFISGRSADLTVAGKVDINSGSISALPSGWVIRKTERSYVRFSSDSPNQHGTFVKLVLENDATVLRISECPIRTWTHHVSLSDKEGNPFSSGRWAAAIRSQTNQRQARHSKILSLAAMYLLSFAGFGGNFGPCDWRVFPALFIEQKPSNMQHSSNNFGIGLRCDQGIFSIELQMFADVPRNASVIVHFAKVLDLHISRSQLERLANIGLTVF